MENKPVIGISASETSVSYRLLCRALEQKNSKSVTTRDTILQCRTVPLNSGALGTLKRTPTQPLTELHMSAPGIRFLPLATFPHLLLLNREEVCGTEDWLSKSPTYSPVDRIEVYCSNNERSAYYNATRGSSLSLQDY